ncbi:hypothetical protein RND71_000836 [Anisodus tanguticus]|uniref:DEAD/DEAH-box helicase domain-containing protein n=1 Tax=Anisodus tanguticus TaxID=243964 RepID=A0AAE1SY32_9SOLA|nr:hypothetical protein RND71_000836 [Anisodus tanguticus]
MAGSGSQFDARQFDAKMAELQQEEFFTLYDEVYESFDGMGLQENLMRASMPMVLRSHLLFSKGALFPLPRPLTLSMLVLQQLDYSLVECQALVLAPTRELAQQIDKVMRALGDYLGVKVHACVGGTSVRED